MTSLPVGDGVVEGAGLTDSGLAAGSLANSGTTDGSPAADGLATIDPAVAQALRDELRRQQDQIELIASENIVSMAVLQAQGSVLTNKYAEGYPGRRYYGGCQFVDVVERLAIERACRLFGCGFANVQPHSGAQANQAVFLALLSPGDKLLALGLDAGGHLTHGAAPTLSGKWFEAIHYGVDPQTQQIDFDQLEQLAREHRPRLVIAGGSAYPRIIDFARFRQIADDIAAWLMVDMAHFAGLVAGGVYPSPLPYAHVVTTTNHKTLRGPRGGMILWNDPELTRKFNSAVFPGLQGGPLMHVIAAKAVALQEALRAEFADYTRAVVDNARAMAGCLKAGGFSLVAGGTDSHLILLDLRRQEVTGRDAESALGRAHLTCNKNAIPFDPLKPALTSGIRLGTPAVTTRGFTKDECIQVAEMIQQVVVNCGDRDCESQVRQQAVELCGRFPIYPNL